jgi:sulfide:quinone oxidoreductase
LEDDMAAFRRITDRFSVSPQLGPDDIARARAEGFATIIANRPDGEEPGAMTLAEARRLAEAAGLRFVAIPFSGSPTPEVVAKVGAALVSEPGPVLAYCRSGTRSTTAWAMASAAAGVLDTQAIIAAAHDGGYDLSGLARTLDGLRPGK